MPVVYDNINANAASGTELMLRGLEQRLDKSHLEKISVGRAIQLFKNHPTKRIYWTHNLPWQGMPPAVNERASIHPAHNWRDVDNIVFVSDWQKQKYINHYKYSEQDQHRFRVLRNAIQPIPEHTKPNDKIRLIYTSVPERGLNVLYYAFDNVSKKFPNIELDVYSSYRIYGMGDWDNRYRRLFDQLRSHPQINYHGTVSNSEIHQALQRAHIFAYPSVFMETSCVSIIEAMSAGCVCVHSDIAALKETTAGYTNMYPFVSNFHEHVRVYEQQLEKAILQCQAGVDLSAQKQYTDSNYSWDVRIGEWEQFINQICE